MGSQKIVAAFEKKMGWDKTTAGAIATWLKRDALLLTDANAKHKLLDVYLEVIQLANRDKVDLDAALAKHLKEAGKKYGKPKGKVA